MIEHVAIITARLQIQRQSRGPVSLARQLVIFFCRFVVVGESGIVQRASTIVIVVRHAETDTIPQDDTPLTPAGIACAATLEAALRHADVQAVITTQLIRSRLTGRPLADALGLRMITVPRGDDIPLHASRVAAAGSLDRLGFTKPRAIARKDSVELNVVSSRTCNNQ